MEKPQGRSYLQANNNGFTLVGILIVLVVLSVLGLSILMITSNSVKISAGERDDQSVFYIAEAGVTLEMAEIEMAIKAAYTETKVNDVTAAIFFDVLETKIFPSTSYNFEPAFGKTPSAIIEVKDDEEASNLEDKRFYKVTSTGSIEPKKRIVERNFSVQWFPSEDEENTPTNPISIPGNMGIFVKENITLDSAGTITGSIGTLKPGANSITIKGGKPTSYVSVNVPIGYEGSAVSAPDWMGNVAKVVGTEMGEFPELPEFPIIPTYPSFGDISSINNKKNGSTLITLDGNLSMGDLKVTNGHTLTIDIGDTDKELVLDGLEVSGSAQIIIKGSGNLKLYVKNTFKIEGSAKLNAQTPQNKLAIYYKGPEFNLDGHTTIYGSIYAERAKVEVGGSDALYGSILSGGSSFIVRGGGNVQPSLYFAPNAHFEVRNSGKVYGTIIGESINVSGMGEVHYREPLADDWIWDAGNNPGNEPRDPEENSDDIQNWIFEKGSLIEK